MIPTVRLLTEKDTDAYRALRLRALETDPLSFYPYPDEEGGLTLQQFAERLASPPGLGVLGAFAEGQLLGLVGLVQNPRRKLMHKASVVGVFVAPEARGRGLGRQLMQAAIERASSLPTLTRLVLAVHGNNRAAIALYRSLGFEPFGYEPDAIIVDGEAHAEILMGMTLRR